MLFDLLCLSPITKRVLTDAEIFGGFSDSQVVVELGHDLGGLMIHRQRRRVYQTLPTKANWYVEAKVICQKVGGLSPRNSMRGTHGRWKTR